MSFELCHFPLSLQIEYILDAMQRATEQRNPRTLGTLELWSVLQELWCLLPTT